MGVLPDAPLSELHVEGCRLQVDHEPADVLNLQFSTFNLQPIHAALAQQQRRPAQTGKIEGANPSRGTNFPAGQAGS